MQKKSLTLLSSIGLILCVSVLGYAQGGVPAKPAESVAALVAITATTTPLDLARAALAAQGGEKFKNLKSMVVSGDVNFYPPNQTQSLPGKFVIVTMGDKIRMDFDARPVMVFNQIYDGKKYYSSSPAIEQPPPSKAGPAVLAKFDQAGFTVSALPDDKKLRGFRIADSEGNTTDFYIDPANGRVVRYIVPFAGNTFATENQKMKEVDGVLVAYNYTQRVQTPQGSFFAEYSVKDAKLNQQVSDDLFVIPN